MQTEYTGIDTLRLVTVIQDRLRVLGSAKADRELAAILGHDRNAVKGWNEGAKVRDDNLCELIELAITLGIEPLEFCPALDTWHFDKTYQDALEIAPLLLPIRSTFAVNHRVPLLGHELCSPFGMASGITSASPKRIRSAFKTGLGFVVTKSLVLRNRGVRHP